MADIKEQERRRIGGFAAVLATQRSAILAARRPDAFFNRLLAWGACGGDLRGLQGQVKTSIRSKLSQVPESRTRSRSRCGRRAAWRLAVSSRQEDAATAMAWCGARANWFSGARDWKGPLERTLYGTVRWHLLGRNVLLCFGLGFAQRRARPTPRTVRSGSRTTTSGSPKRARLVLACGGDRDARR